MRKKTLALLALATAAVGCSQEAPQQAAQAGSATFAADAPAGSDREIAVTAETFMRAILAGNAPKASTLLTAKGAERYASDSSVLPAMGMIVEQFAMGEVLLLNADEAAAQCLVTEPGSTTAQELCCLLKREANGWRVAGVAANGLEDEAAVISFEGEPQVPVRPSQLVDQAPAGTETPRTAAGESPATVR